MYFVPCNTIYYPANLCIMGRDIYLVESDVLATSPLLGFLNFVAFSLLCGFRGKV